MVEEIEPDVFSGFGTIATGSRFVGRAEECARLHERVVSGGGSSAVVGIARIGKSSVAAQVSRSVAGHEVSAHWLDLSTFESGRAFFDAWAEESAATELQPSGSTHVAFRRLSRLLQTRSGRRLVIVIDEFDAVRGFEDAGNFMRLLRELLYDPGRTKVTAIICSRREIARLELETMDVSTLAGVLDHISIRPFNPQELETLFARSEQAVTENLRSAVASVAGGHPYLAEMCLSHGLAAERNDADVQETLRASSVRYFEHTTRFLASESLMLEAVQSVVGPRVSSDRLALNQLLRYGVLATEERGFSDEFESWLASASLDTDLWGLFGKVESALRRLIDLTLSEELGPSWMDVLAKRHRSVSILLDQAERLRASDAAKFTGAQFQPLLRYTYPAQLLDIIQSEWVHFQPVLGRDLRYWRPRLELLSRVRAPFAHSRGDVVPEADVRLAEIYCREILESVEVPAPGAE